MSRRFDVEVSIALGADITASPSSWAWTDITSYAMVREGGVTIRRGRADWQTASPPATCTVLLNNADGRFSRLNPTGTYYGQLTKNTPLRIRAREVSGSYSTRFVGFVADWPVEWEPSESHFWCSVTAAGALRRVGLTAKPFKSVVERLVQQHGSAVIGYWPLNDPVSSTSGRPAVGTAPMLVDTNKAVVDSTGRTTAIRPVWNGTELAPWLGTGVEMERFGTDTEEDSPQMLVYPGATGGEEEWAVDVIYRGNPSGDLPQLNVGYEPALGYNVFVGGESPNTTDVSLYTWNQTTFVVSDTFGPFSAPTAFANDQLHHMRLYATTNSSARLTLSLYFDGVLLGSGTSASLGLAPLRYMQLFIPGVRRPGTKVIVGHVIAWGGASGSIPSISDTYEAVLGYAGETAHDRVNRLCTEEGVAVDVTATVSFAMGAQSMAPFMTLLRECEVAGPGLLLERRTGEVGFDAFEQYENQVAALAVDYSTGHVHPPLQPVDDDQATRNSVTVSMPDGAATAQYELVSGPQGSDPITGAGLYEESITANAAEERQLFDLAGYRVGLGTVDGHRYPLVNLKLHRSSGLISSWKAADVGDRVTIDNLPSKLPPELVDQILEGYTERINQMEWDVTLNLSPYKPHLIIEMADTYGDSNDMLGRAANDDNCAIRSAITSSGTSIDIDPNRGRWTTLLIKDTFTRSVGSSWGTPDLGIAWSTDVGTAADFSVNGSVGIMSHPSAGVNHSQIIFTGPDTDSVIQFNLPAAPVGAGGQAIVVVRPRWTDADNHYEVRATVATSGAITTELRKRVAASPTTLQSGPNLTLNTSRWYALRISTVGTAIRAKVWDTVGTEPDWQMSVTDTSLTTGNFISVLSVAPSITNLPYTVNFDNFAVSGATGQPDDFNPLPVVRFGGETASVKGISTTAVTFVAAGAASHADNSAVSPAVYAGSAANDGLFLVGRIRGTTGSLATPAGYTLLKRIGRLYLWMKVHSGSESSPTLTPSGGASGDTVSGFTFGFRGTPCTLSDLTASIVDSNGIVNASAANIAHYAVYPYQQDGCLLLLIGGKSDDWTSAAPPSGWTEIAEPTTTTGNDQSLYAAYQIQTAPALANEGSIVVTGGASAVSESMTLALAAGYQTLTINTRSTNGIVKSHAAGTKLEVENPYVLGL